MRRGAGKSTFDGGSNEICCCLRSGHCEVGIGRRDCQAEGMLEAEACWSRVICMQYEIASATEWDSVSSFGNSLGIVGRAFEKFEFDVWQLLR